MEEILSPACVHCGGIIGQSDKFCGQCGREINATPSYDKGEDVFSILKPTLLFYFITLFVLALFKHTPSFEHGFNGMMTITVIYVLIVIAFWIYHATELQPLFALSKINIKVLVLTILGATIGAVIVSFIAPLINISINDDVFYDIYMFQDTRYPLLFATLFIAVQPAIFEEVAFRGFLFSNLERVTSPTSVVYITAFLFGIMHLTIISLIWLIPIGIAFALLRKKYNTLWYGIVGHFVYNFSVTLIDYYGLF
jgi:membrane protease YdiL (CAAX protease family)